MEPKCGPFMHGAPCFHIDYLRCEYHEFNRGEDVFDYARARRFSPLPEPSPERYDY